MMYHHVVVLYPKVKLNVLILCQDILGLKPLHLGLCIDNTPLARKKKMQKQHWLEKIIFELEQGWPK